MARLFLPITSVIAGLGITVFCSSKFANNHPIDDALEKYKQRTYTQQKATIKKHEEISLGEIPRKLSEHDLKVKEIIDSGIHKQIFTALKNAIESDGATQQRLLEIISTTGNSRYIPIFYDKFPIGTIFEIYEPVILEVKNQSDRHLMLEALVSSQSSVKITKGIFEGYTLKTTGGIINSLGRGLFSEYVVLSKSRCYFF